MRRLQVKTSVERFREIFFSTFIGTKGRGMNIYMFRARAIQPRVLYAYTRRQ